MSRPRPPRLRPALAAAALACAAGAVRAAPADEPADPWDLLVERRFAAARAAFLDEPESPEQRLGLALSRLRAPPLTRGAIQEADRLLALVAADPAAAPDDRHAAAFFRARILQVHLPEPDWPAARASYRALFADAPASPWAQLGVTRLALLELYDPDLGDDLSKRFHDLESLGQGLTHGPAKRDFHYILGCAAIFHGLPDEWAQRHLEASIAAHPSSAINEANVQVRLAETARARGDLAAAARAYRRFVEIAPRDLRTRLARERLAAIEAGEVAP